MECDDNSNRTNDICMHQNITTSTHPERWPQWRSVVGSELEGRTYDFFGPSSFFPMSFPRSLTPRTRSSFARICGFGIARPAS